jgi:hypothetical protein
MTNSELKTLEDLESPAKGFHGFASIIELRHEAIRLIKGLEKHNFYCVICEKFGCDCGSSDCFKPKFEQVDELIRYLFNITEKDLTRSSPKGDSEK